MVIEWEEYIKKHFPTMKAAIFCKEGWIDGLYPTPDGKIKEHNPIARTIGNGGSYDPDRVYGTLPEGYKVRIVKLVQNNGCRRSTRVITAILPESTRITIASYETRISMMQDEIARALKDTPEPPPPNTVDALTRIRGFAASRSSSEDQRLIDDDSSLILVT